MNYQAYQQPPYRPPAPQPYDDQRTLAGLAHLASFFLPFVLPLVLYAANLRKPFARASAAQAMVLQAVQCAVSFVAPAVFMLLMFDAMFDRSGEHLETLKTLLPLITIFPFVAPLPFVIVGVVGAVRAFRGQPFRLPLVGRLVESVFGKFPPSDGFDQTNEPLP
ncbi:MAG: DUF4870 domain-containing protein [Polyangiaceae bacterium]|nr:DUF4870 domain-containing protein [Polyangiaceae bacterium]